MSDVIDRASQEEEFILASNIYLAVRKPDRLVPMGSCYYCREEVEGKKLFCNLDCSDDHQKEKRQLKRMGNAQYD